MLPIASTFATATQTATGTPTPLAIPTAIKNVFEVRAKGAVAWEYRASAADTPYTVAADTEVSIPVAAEATPILLSGAGAVNYVVFGRN